jgi:hypothetical protein
VGQDFLAASEGKYTRIEVYVNQKARALDDCTRYANQARICFTYCGKALSGSGRSGIHRFYHSKIVETRVTSFFPGFAQV